MGTYNIHAGHSLKCRGASKYLDEVNEDRKVKNKVIALLKAKGHTVYDCTDDAGTTASANLQAIVAKCNAHKVNLDVSIHLNAGGGTGVEVWNYSEGTKTISDRICKNINNTLGIKNRGTKYSQGLYVLKHTKSPAILIECCFVDSQTDAGIWNADKCAEAIVSGILGAKVSEEVAEVVASTPKKKAIEVNGKWDKNTTKKAQEVFHTPIDGRISNQLSCYKNICKGITSAEWTNKKKGGSLLIKAMQKWLGIKQDERDGYIGPQFIKALQKKMGTPVDGRLDNSSACVKAFQKWLNKQ